MISLILSTNSVKGMNMSEFVFFENLNSKIPLSTYYRDPVAIHQYEVDFNDVKPFACDDYILNKRLELIKSYDPTLMDKARGNSKEQKKFREGLQKFSQTVWSPIMVSVVENGYRRKFEIDRVAKEFLINTQGLIVNVNLFDPIWAIGRPITHAEIKNPKLWKGNNLLGQVLMNTRNELLGLPKISYSHDKVNKYRNYWP